MIGLATVVVVALAGAVMRSTATGASSAPVRLVAFHSCGDLLGYVKARTAPLIGPYGLGGGPTGVATPVPNAAAGGRESAPQEGVDYSGTNVQEQGVDEPDMVKTDGTTLFALANGKLDAVDVELRQAPASRHAPPRRAAGATSCSSMGTACSSSPAAASGPSRCRRRRRA